ncbi:DUF1707 SHOCT-like domain-containing protein [Corynebacterium doosanense]|uniref:Membrane protein n=1 Tax=Corynebacterium doosanense CAU 212 = DSM 45436 TaxID=558173 RepID=A0A097ICV8_9CORY|nr:DUF1707 domain-containing protein [Corynebacterium doosanense]AIT59948.1 membrane protein [Corynebacterium doosanense CAU 212 = DSM 45436]
MTDDSTYRAGDADRSEALDRLGTYFADGFLTVHEFDERSGRAAGAQTHGELASLFDDLPGLSASNRAEPPAHRMGSEVAAQEELDDVLARNRKVQAVDAVIWSVTMIAFFLGLFVFHWNFFWVVFPVAALASWGARAVFQLSDEEEELAEELTQKEKEERAERLRLAAEKRRELGQ